MSIQLNVDDTGMIYLLPKEAVNIKSLISDYLSFRISEESEIDVIRYENGFVYKLEDGALVLGIDGNVLIP